MYLRFGRVPCEENKKFETNNGNLILIIIIFFAFLRLCVRNLL